MAKTVSLAGVADLKAHLPVRDGVTTFDERIKSVLRTATTQIQVACRRVFAKQAYVETLNAKTTTALMLDIDGPSSLGEYNKTVYMKVILRGAPVDPDTFEARYDRSRVFADSSIIPADCISFDDDLCTVYIRFPMYDSARSLKLTYQAGWAAEAEEDIADEDWLTTADAAPDDLREACVLQALNLWQRNALSTVGLQADENSKVKNGNNFVVKGGLLPDVVAMVAPYRKLLSGRN